LGEKARKPAGDVPGTRESGPEEAWGAPLRHGPGDGDAEAHTGEGPTVLPEIPDLDAFAGRARTHTLTVSAMAFQDAWTLDLDRVRDCCIHVMARDGRLVPFCLYNLTDTSGRSLHRP
jgi:hypothetical protein